VEFRPYSGSFNLIKMLPQMKLLGHQIAASRFIGLIERKCPCTIPRPPVPTARVLTLFALIEKAIDL
jgi:hypothetical protein